MSDTPPVNDRTSVISRVIKRKTHRKSRLGCTNCKRRRIKCDELKPSCTHCVQHKKNCEYIIDVSTPRSSHSFESSADRATAPDSSSQQEIAAPAVSESTAANLPHRLRDTAVTANDPIGTEDHTGFDARSITDLELLHNFINSTSHTLASLDSLETFWRVDVLDIGFSYHFVLHCVLAVSALHLRRFKRDRFEHYNALHERHWTLGLRQATALLPNITDDSRNALYIFSVMACFNVLGRGPQRGDFLVYGPDGISEWFVLFRGVKTIITPNMIETGPLAAMFRISSLKLRKFSEWEESNELKAIKTLRHMLKRNDNDAYFEMYKKTIDDLSRCYTMVLDSDDAQTTPKYSQAVFLWLYLLPDEYLVCIQELQPLALAIFAYFIVIFSKVPSTWVLDGWTYHLIEGTYFAMKPVDRSWIRWPMEQIGWIPPL